MIPTFWTSEPFSPGSASRRSANSPEKCSRWPTFWDNYMPYSNKPHHSYHSRTHPGCPSDSSSCKSFCFCCRLPLRLPSFGASTPQNAKAGPRRFSAANGRWWEPRSCRAYQYAERSGWKPLTFKIHLIARFSESQLPSELSTDSTWEVAACQEVWVCNFRLLQTPRIPGIPNTQTSKRRGISMRKASPTMA